MEEKCWKKFSFEALPVHTIEKYFLQEPMYLSYREPEAEKSLIYPQSSPSLEINFSLPL
jgi:hypothetical protein